ncbi:MAG: metallophosphoesterase [Polyangiales bacterium]
MAEPLRIAVVGDVHLRWDATDVAQLDEAGYDLVLFVGDLAGYRERGGLQTARRIAPLRTPALLMPGNHDAVPLLQLAAETCGWRRTAHWLGGTQDRRCHALEEALGDVPLAGYSLHTVGEGPGAVSIVAGRPHSMGGPRLAFARHLRRHFGIESLEQSAERLRALVDRAEHERLVFFAHNGPSGLGARRDDIWGCDFKAEEGDWGDPDLRDAIDYARTSGHRVLAVCAGHMHHALKGGGHRPWELRRDGILYVNAARVPRVFQQGGRELRHHVRLQIDENDASVHEVIWPTV